MPKTALTYTTQEHFCPPIVAPHTRREKKRSHAPRNPAVPRPLGAPCASTAARAPDCPRRLQTSPLVHPRASKIEPKHSFPLRPLRSFAAPPSPETSARP